MTTGLTNQLNTYFSGLDADQGPVTVDDVARLIDKVREVTDEPATTRSTPRVWVGAVAPMAVFVVLGSVSILLATTRNGSPPASETPIVTTVPNSAPTTTGTTEVTTTVASAPETTLPDRAIPPPLGEETVRPARSVRDIAVHGDLAIAVGWGVWTSTDLTTWELVENLGDNRFSPALEDIAAGDAGIVASGSTDEIVFSEDGRLWERVSLPAEAPRSGGSDERRDFASRVVAAGPGFVAAGTRIWTSVDGRVWTVASGEVPVEAVTEMATNGDSIVIFAGDDVWTSIDGDVWTAHPGAVPSAAGSTCTGERPNDIQTLHGDSDGFIVTGSFPYLAGGPAAAWSSSDGINWSQTELPEAGDTQTGILTLAHGNGRYVAVGLTWHWASDPPPGGFPVGSCPDLVNPTPVAWTSLDGANWTVLDQPPAPPFSYIEGTKAAVASIEGHSIRAWIIGNQVLLSINGGTTRLWTPHGLNPEASQ